MKYISITWSEPISTQRMKYIKEVVIATEEHLDGTTDIIEVLRIAERAIIEARKNEEEFKNKQ